MSDVDVQQDALLLYAIEEELDQPLLCEARTGTPCGQQATHWVICPRCNDHKPWCLTCVQLMRDLAATKESDGTMQDLACRQRFPQQDLRVEPIG